MRCVPSTYRVYVYPNYGLLRKSAHPLIAAHFGYCDKKSPGIAPGARGRNNGGIVPRPMVPAIPAPPRCRSPRLAGLLHGYLTGASPPVSVSPAPADQLRGQRTMCLSETHPTVGQSVFRGFPLSKSSSNNVSPWLVKINAASGWDNCIPLPIRTFFSPKNVFFFPIASNTPA